MEPINLVKICPECSFANSDSSRRCEKCDARLTDVIGQPASLSHEPSILSAKDIQNRIPGGLSKSPLAQPPLKPQTQNVLSKLPSFRMLQKRKRAWLVVVILVVVMVILLIIMVPRLPTNETASHGSHVTKGSAPTNSIPFLSLPPHLGEVTASNGQHIGVNDGSFAPFDIGRPTQELKQKAALN